jgi:hydrogenase nickel incorporation protein HypA/HybF
MHEFSICQRILEATLEEYAALEPVPLRLKSVRVVSGGMHQIVPDYLQTAYECLSKETPAEGSSLHLVIQPVIGHCNSCGWQGEIQQPFFQCGSCEALDIELLHGRELYIDGLEIEIDEHERD